MNSHAPKGNKSSMLWCAAPNMADTGYDPGFIIKKSKVAFYEKKFIS